LITLLNDGTLISVGYDNVTPSKTPNRWNLPALFFVSAVLAGVALGSSLLLLWAGLDSWKEGSIFQETGLGGLRYGQIICMIYLKVSISDFLTLFSARTHDGFFWSSKPSPILLGAACVALLLSTILACVWPTGKTDSIPAEGLARDSPESLAFWVWLYCIVWWFIQDLAKVCCYAVMEKYNLFGVNDTLVDQEWIEDGNNEDDTLLPKERGLKEKLISSV